MAAASEASKTFTSQDSLLKLAAKNPDRTFLLIQNKVYDVTNFLSKHPGGEDVLRENRIRATSLRDATRNFEDVGHSAHAREHMKKFLLGAYEPNKMTNDEISIKKDDKKVFSQEQLVKMADQNKDRTYVAIHDNVYDVTNFREDHPGGEEALLEHSITGTRFTDATSFFEDVKHSKDARQLMKEYQIGIVVVIYLVLMFCVLYFTK